MGAITTIVIGEVADARVNEHHVPLLYHDRHWRRPADLEDQPAAPAPRGQDAPIADLDTLLRALGPALDPVRYVFATVDDAQARGGRGVLASVREAEGTTLVLGVDTAVERGLPATPVFRRIVLSVFSDLQAVGLIAAVAGRLASAGVPCNVLSAFHHDHLFVPDADAERAMEVLRAPW